LFAKLNRRTSKSSLGPFLLPLGSGIRPLQLMSLSKVLGRPWLTSGIWRWA
jgi:hypothetical protein